VGKREGEQEEIGGQTDKELETDSAS